jgi:hypothetical protein
MHWRWYGYINHHNPADHDGSTDSRQWRWQTGFLSLCEQCMDRLCGHKGHNQPFPITQPCSCLIPFLSERGNITNHQQLGHRRKLNLDMSPRRVRCLNLTGRLRQPASTQPVLVRHSLHSEEAGSEVLRKDGALQHNYTAGFPAQKTATWISHSCSIF